MPLRLINSASFDLLVGALATIMLAAGSVLESIANGDTIYDQGQLRMYCIIGAMGGAFLAVALFPPRELEGSYARRLALKFFASGVSGMLFTPVIMRWQGWPLNSDTVLAVSGAVALAAVSVIHAIIPLFVRSLSDKLRNFGEDKEQ